MKYIDNILSSHDIFAISIQARNNLLLFPLEYFSGKGISIKLRTAYAAASLCLQFSELIAVHNFAPNTVK